MAEGVGPGRGARVFRMALVLALAGLLGGFLHLRSVDPAAVADEESADRIVLKAEQVPGFAFAERQSEAAIRAGLRRDAQRGGGEDEEREDGTEPEPAAPDQDRFQERFSECLGGGVRPSGLVDRVYARAFGVDDPGDRASTAEVTVVMRNAAAGGQPFRLFATGATMLASEAALEESLRELESVGLDKLGSCLAEAFSDLGSTTSTALPSAVEGTRSFGYRVQLTPSAAPVSVAVDMFFLLRGRAIAQLAAFGVGEPFPDDQRQVLLDLLGQRLRAEMGDEAV